MGAPLGTVAGAVADADVGDDAIADPETGPGAAVATIRDVSRTTGRARGQKVPCIPLPHLLRFPPARPPIDHHVGLDVKPPMLAVTGTS
jgi:hypothetical protein